MPRPGRGGELPLPRAPATPSHAPTPSSRSIHATGERQWVEPPKTAAKNSGPGRRRDRPGRRLAARASAVCDNACDRCCATRACNSVSWLANVHAHGGMIKSTTAHSADASPGGGQTSDDHALQDAAAKSIPNSFMRRRRCRQQTRSAAVGCTRSSSNIGPHPGAPLRSQQGKLLKWVR